MKKQYSQVEILQKNEIQKEITKTKMAEAFKIESKEVEREISLEKTKCENPDLLCDNPGMNINCKCVGCM